MFLLKRLLVVLHWVFFPSCFTICPVRSSRLCVAYSALCRAVPLLPWPSCPIGHCLWANVGSPVLDLAVQKPEEAVSEGSDQ